MAEVDRIKKRAECKMFIKDVDDEEKNKGKGVDDSRGDQSALLVLLSSSFPIISCELLLLRGRNRLT